MDNKEIGGIQKALFAAGFNPGKIDGIWGRRTISALVAFQKEYRLTSDGIFGPLTSAKLAEVSASLAPLDLNEMPWSIEATRLLTTREFLGPRDNPLILDWAGLLSIPYKGDDIPWCGLFVGHCIAMALPQEIMPNGLLSARAWLTFGSPTTPKTGAVLIFWRETADSWKGHVGFYAGEDENNYRILGGNQSDSVCYAWIAKDRLLGARWPHSALSLLAAARIVNVDKTTDLSLNEE